MNSEKVIEKIIETLTVVFSDRNVSNVDFQNIDLEKSELEIDSITFICIIVALEEAFDIEFPDEKILLSELNTINKLASVIIDELKK